MENTKPNKRKIINDPVYGFISIKDDFVFDLIEHPWFQRLRRIKQLGLTHLVYPGAHHTRFHHALGAMHLMDEAIEVIRSKGHHVTEQEASAAAIAILMHDIGHGPFSHALENCIVYGFSHEHLSNLFMERLDNQFKGRLKLALDIFRNRYHKKFLHQLVSSQLDVDRLDYLKRDSFFTGVSEGITGTDRIIAMMNVVDDKLVIDAKGIYSIEKFIIARRLMYWQVYLHKTVIAAETILIKILQRAKYLFENGKHLFATPALSEFLSHRYNKNDFKKDVTLLETFALLDDHDIQSAIKVWCGSDDRILSLLCNKLINRQLLHVEMQNEPFAKDYISLVRKKVGKTYKLNSNEADLFVYSGLVENNAYLQGTENINILNKDGSLTDIAEASDQLNISVLSKTVTKYYLCYPKECC